MSDSNVRHLVGSARDQRSPSRKRGCTIGFIGKPSAKVRIFYQSATKNFRSSIAQLETVAKVNSLTILPRLSWLCRKDEAQGAEGEV